MLRFSVLLKGPSWMQVQRSSDIERCRYVFRRSFYPRSPLFFKDLMIRKNSISWLLHLQILLQGLYSSPHILRPSFSKTLLYEFRPKSSILVSSAQSTCSQCIAGLFIKRQEVEFLLENEKRDHNDRVIYLLCPC